MMETYSREKKNNLELYLNDVYEKECEFKIEQGEIEFIQTGIETLVQGLVDKILTHETSFQKLLSSIPIDERWSELTSKEKHDEKNTFEVYLPIQSDGSFQKCVAVDSVSIKTVKSTIIKVGSFYDKTKNNFPDEFDFIFPVVGARYFSVFISSFISSGIKDYVWEEIPVYGKSLHYTFHSEEHQVTRKLDFEKFISKSKFLPPFKIQFIYSNEYGERRPINVDLVPAIRIIDSNTQRWFVEKVRDYVEPKTFREEILAARSCLWANGELAFTVTEQHFMKNILSKKHVKVYRILKYLLNGHGDDEEVNEYIKRSHAHEVYYTSYDIKKLMIYHHEVCADTDAEDLGPCVLQVLNEMSTYESDERFPKFIEFSSDCMFGLLPVLKSTITTLQSMQISENSYRYERDKIKSVSRQYMDRKKWLRCVIL